MGWHWTTVDGAVAELAIAMPFTVMCEFADF
jgi:hypothetical protein